MAKGSSFEREICKQLSRWWTGGKRDDIFWRSCQSGGRATQRMKSGRKTYGSYGDIAAVDPIGEPLLRLFTIELKRGRSHGSAADLIDCPSSDCPRPFEQTLMQAWRSHIDAGSKGWMLICRRDYKIPVVYADLDTLQLFVKLGIFKAPCIKFRVPVLTEKDKARIVMRFAAMPLACFLRRITAFNITTMLS